MRKSGTFDLYYDGARVYTSKKGKNNPYSSNPIVKIRDIEMTYDAIYLQMDKDYYQKKTLIKQLRPNEEQEKVYELKDVKHDEIRVRVLELKWENEISYENSEFKSGFNMNNLFFQRIKKYCKPFTGFCLVSTVLVVAHRNIISIFSILSQKWMNHLFFKSEIKDLFRNHGEISVTAFFQDQSIKVIKQEKQASMGEEQEPWVNQKDRELTIQEKIVDCA